MPVFSHKNFKSNIIKTPDKRAANCRLDFFKSCSFFNSGIKSAPAIYKKPPALTGIKKSTIK